MEHNKKYYDDRARERLIKIRDRTGHLIEKNIHRINDAVTLSTRHRSARYSYADFLEKASLLDMAVKKKQWQFAEELAAFLTEFAPYKTDKRCFIIVNRILKEADIEVKNAEGKNS